MNFSIVAKLKYIAIITVMLLISANSALAQPKDLPTFAPLIEKTMGAVVNISTTQSIDVKGGGQHPFFRFNFPDSPEMDLFRDFFDREFNQSPEGETRKKRTGSLGSGFIIDPKGFVVTNNHVIADADEINVTVTINGEEKTFPAELIGRDQKTDLAVLKIQAKQDLPYMSFGDSKKSKVGDWIIAIGNPFGLGGTVTKGIISAKARFIPGQFDEFIQTDASINRGNSGGPMLNMDGEVIGVNSVIISPSGGNVGIGLAIPSDSAQKIVTQLRSNGAITRSWLGVKIQAITDDFSKNLGFKDNKGALVAEVVDGSPAEKGGIKTGDVIRKFDGKVIEKMPMLPSIVAETAVGKKVIVEVVRDGNVKTLLVTTEKFEDESSDAKDKKEAKKGEKSSGKSATLYGMKVENLNKVNRGKYNIDKEDNGVLITRVNRNSAAADTGLQPGDIIKQVNNSHVKSVSDLEKLLEKAKKSGSKTVVMLVSRDGGNLFTVMYLN